MRLVWRNKIGNKQSRSLTVMSMLKLLQGPEVQWPVPLAQQLNWCGPAGPSATADSRRQLLDGCGRGSPDAESPVSPHSMMAPVPYCIKAACQTAACQAQGLQRAAGCSAVDADGAGCCSGMYPADAGAAACSAVTTNAAAGPTAAACCVGSAAVEAKALEQATTAACTATMWCASESIPANCGSTRTRPRTQTHGRQHTAAI